MPHKSSLSPSSARKKRGSPRVLRVGAKVVVEDIDGLLEGMVLAEELLGSGGGPELEDPNDSRDDPREDHHRDHDARLRVEDQRREFLPSSHRGGCDGSVREGGEKRKGATDRKRGMG